MADGMPLRGGLRKYIVTEDFQRGTGITYKMTVPSGMAVIEIPTVRVGRYGGPTPDDLQFREELYQAVGSVTVAGGHIEASMKRLLLILGDSDTIFSLVDLQWADLHTRLLQECDDRDNRRRELRRALDWAERRELRERRHTVVHGAWWLFSGCGARVSRWPRRASGHVELGEMDELARLAVQCWELVRRLDELLGEDWPRAMLPSGPSLPEAFRRSGRPAPVRRVPRDPG